MTAPTWLLQLLIALACSAAFIGGLAVLMHTDGFRQPEPGCNCWACRVARGGRG